MANRTANQFITSIEFHRAWIAVCEYYLRMRPKEDVAAILNDLIEVEHESIELLARALRQMGAAPGVIDMREDLVRDGKLRSNTRSRMQFIDVGLTQSLAWYEQRLSNANSPHHDLWQALYDLQKPVAERIRALLSQIEGSK